MKVIKVNEKYNGKKLSQFLFDNFDGLTNNTFNKALRKKDIRINGIRVSENKVIFCGDEIKIYVIDELLYKELKENSEKNFDIIYEDDNIVVFNKPSDIEVTGENSMEVYAEKMYKNQFIKPCHRLDRNTTGLVLFAKNEESLDNKKSMVYISDIPKTGYRKIITSYTIIKKDFENNLSVLDVELHTGRTHQIRAHLAHIGHPILGDGKYGINNINNINFIINQT